MKREVLSCLQQFASILNVPAVKSSENPIEQTHKLARFAGVLTLLCIGLFAVSPASATTRTYTGTGLWSSAANWGGTVPQNGDDVVIPAGADVTLDTNTNNLLSLSVGGNLTIGNDATSRVITVTGDVSIASGGSIAAGATDANHQMNVGGNLTNDGTLDGDIGARNIGLVFNGAANQTLSGTGGTTNIDSLTIANTGGTNNNVVEILPTNFTTSTAGFLTLTSGILKMSGAFSFTNTFFSSASYAINSDEGIWINNSNVTVTAQNGDASLSGLLRVSAGNYNIGTAANDDLLYDTGSTIDIQGGALTIAGAIRPNVVASETSYSQSGGVVTVVTVGSTSATFGAFDIRAAGSSFTMSNGTIIHRTATTIQPDFFLGSITNNVTGGTVQFGNASTPALRFFSINSLVAIFNVVVNSTNGPTLILDSAPLTLKNDLTIQTGAKLDANGKDLNIAGNWSNSGSFLQPNFVTFLGTSPELITGSNLTTFNNLTILNSAGVSLSGVDATVTGVLALTSGDLTTGARILNQASGSTSSGANDVIGNVTRTHAFTNATSYAFGNPFVSLNFTGAGTNPTSITFNLVKVAPNDFTNAVTRTYTITPTGGAGFSATLRLHYLDSELNGNSETSPSLELWEKTGGWVSQGATATDTTNNWVERSGVGTFSPWVISGPNAPTDIAMLDLKATRYDKRILLEWQTGYEVSNVGFNIYREQKGAMVKITPEPIAGSALLFGPRVQLKAGYAYNWWDDSSDCIDKECSQKYWIEDIDLKGTTSMRGPFFVSESSSDTHDATKSVLIGSLGSNSAESNRSYPVTASVRQKTLTPTLLTIQSGIASQQAVKLSVKTEGWYRVNQTDLTAAGIPSNVDPSLLQLFVDGTQVPIEITNGGSAPVKGAKPSAAWDGIEFYGLGIDSQYTDSHVYWVVVGTSPGLRVNVLPPAAGAPAPSSFSYTVERRDKVRYFPALKNGGAEKFFGPLISNAQPVDQSVTLHNIAATPTLATLQVSIQGFTDTAHSVRVLLNGAELGTVQFNGFAKGVAQYSVAPSSLLEGNNQIQLIGPSGFFDMSLAEYVRLTYQHTDRADTNFLKLSSPGGQQVTVDGFTTNAIRVVDVTNPNAPQELTATVGSGTSFSATFTAPGAGSRTLLAFTTDQKKPAASISANQPSNWTAKTNSADYVAITRKNFLLSLSALLQQRTKQGLKSVSIDVEDIYDEFSFGNKTPQALKDFFVYAKTNWKKAPRFAALVGDASYDPKNYLGVGDFDIVPTKLIETNFNETATDDWFVDVNNDSIPDIAIGRLPVRTPQESIAMVSKIITYDRTEQVPRVILFADHFDGYDFESASTQLQPLIPGAFSVTDIRRAQVGDSNARTQLIGAINRGARFINFYGHGSSRLWTDAQILSADDAPALLNYERLAMFDAMTCLNGLFQNPTIESLGEALMKASGGAVAVWASSGMTDPAAQQVMNQQAVQMLFNGSSLTIGEITAQAKAVTQNADVRRTWILLGDPATRIK